MQFQVLSTYPYTIRDHDAQVIKGQGSCKNCGTSCEVLLTGNFTYVEGGRAFEISPFHICASCGKTFNELFQRFQQSET